MRSRLLCAVGAILLLNSVPAAHPASNSALFKASKTSFAISITRSAPTTLSAARIRFAAETVGRTRDSTGARPPNTADITGTAPIKEITVTDAVTVNVTLGRLRLGGIERLMAEPKSRSGAAL